MSLKKKIFITIAVVDYAILSQKNLSDTLKQLKVTASLLARS